MHQARETRTTDNRVEADLVGFLEAGETLKPRLLRVLNQDSPSSQLSPVARRQIGVEPIEIGAELFVASGMKLKASLHRHLNYC